MYGLTTAVDYKVCGTVLPVLYYLQTTVVIDNVVRPQQTIVMRQKVYVEVPEYHFMMYDFLNVCTLL